jgi:hypothetical protein
MTSPFTHLRPDALVLAAIAALSGGAIRAQQTGQPANAAGVPMDADESSLVLHATVHRVLVDVVVLDARDQPVLGLTQKDLSV